VKARSRASFYLKGFKMKTTYIVGYTLHGSYSSVARFTERRKAYQFMSHLVDEGYESMTFKVERKLA